MSYTFTFSNVAQWTQQDKSDIQNLYSTYFRELGLEFDPALDPDFVHPEKYFMEQIRGAYITIIFTPPPSPPTAASTAGANGDDSADKSNNVTSEEKPTIVGVVGVRNYSDAKNELLGENCCEIKRMYIAEKHRGGGRGRRLLQMLMMKIYSFKYQRVVLDTKTWLKAANALYEQFGFVDTGNYNQNFRADRWMKKDIAEENMTMGFVEIAQQTKNVDKDQGTKENLA